MTLAPLATEDNATSQAIGAVTLATTDMARSVDFYLQLGFHLLYGGKESPFSSFLRRYRRTLPGGNGSSTSGTLTGTS